MINGIHRFREHFKDYKDQYIIIGGFACDLLMTDAGLDFRQTNTVHSPTSYRSANELYCVCALT